MSDERLARERRRVLAEYQRRRAVVDADLYAPWNASAQLLVAGRRRLAADLLQRAHRFPGRHSRCLEIGFGRGGWLAELIDWGVGERQLFGAEVDLGRALEAHRRLPMARLTLADGGCLPWADGSFDLVVLSTVLTSILDSRVKHLLAAEAERVIAGHGALLWYDFAFDNPRNPHVRGIERRELRSLFPNLDGEIRRVTLAPPIARRVAPLSWWLAELLSSLPFLQTHLLAVLVKST